MKLLRTTLVMAAAIVLATPAVLAAPGGYTIDQTISDQAQRTTLAFSGLAIMTGNLEAQSFFPPGKVADYTGFQYLRDNDPDNMGHNTSFLTRVANNVIYVLDDTQFEQLKTLAVAQLAQIDLYGYKRFPLMKAFRRLLDGDIPAGSSGLDLDAVKEASRELYLIDGQISFDRALLYANILSSMSSVQKAHLDAMKGKGWNSWPNITDDQVRERMRGLPQGTAVAVMTYASDLFSWYAGSVEADVYFCPERHGTYYGGFYIKDAPAVGHEGYGIDEQLTATAGSALCDASKGYATQAQAAQISSLVDIQRNNLYAGTTNIVQVRTQIATLLRGLMVSTASSDAVKAQVLTLSGVYGELDGENNVHYATVFAQVYATLSAEQRAKLAALRKSIMSGTYSDGTPFDFSVCTTPFLYSAVIADPSVLAPYIANTDYLFGVGTPGTAPVAAFTFAPSAPLVGQGVAFADASTGSPTAWSWSFGDGGSSTLQNPTHAYATGGAFTVTLSASNASGTSTASKTLTVGASQGTFSLTSDVGGDGGTLPAEYSCDGSGASPAMTWANVPAGTQELALMMTTIPVDGNTKWNWVLYAIPKTATGLARNSTGVGTLGVGTRGTLTYDPPCSQGPGPKLYTFTVYALSGSPQLPSSPDQVTGAVLTQAISSITLGSASLNLTYTRASAGVVASFNVSPSAPQVGQTVTFADTSTGSPTLWSWSFGDGATSNAQNPTHAFAAAGTYTVTLTATGSAGSSTANKPVTVVGTASQRFTVVDTAQAKCYNASSETTCPASGQAFYGQDAQIAGHQPSYTISSDGLTVTDRTTDLVWQRSPDTNGDSVVGSSDKLTWAQAQARPAALNAASYGGYSDWRLPTIKELYSLIEFKGADPSSMTGDTSGLTPFIDATVFRFAYGDTSAGERVIDSQYASSTLCVGPTMPTEGGKLFGVNFADGRIKGYGLTMPSGGEKTFFVQCVRGNASYGINDLVDNHDDTITDRASGLMWARTDSGTGLNWQEALAWVQARNTESYLGHSDWRLPNAKELQSIVDYTRSPDTTSSAAINAAFDCTGITNEAGQADFPYYWTGTTHASSNGTGLAAVYVAFGRAMGYMNGTWVDVHGAGAQRSDPKSGDPADYPHGRGPQGDAIRINNSVRLVRDTTSAPVTITASFTYAPIAPKAGQSVTFTDTSSGVPTAWSWTFGDGNTSTVQSPSHVYSSSGTFNVTLTASNTAGWSSASRSITVTSSSGASLTYPVVDTGQAACYGNSTTITCPAGGEPFYGQDAQYTTAAPAYRDNGNGTVTDLVTGLTWQQNYDNHPHSWTEAQDLVSALNRQQLGGYSDWRLPTIKELYSLWYASTGWPYVNTTYFPLSDSSGQNAGHTIFFSGTKYVGLMESTSSTTPGDGPGAQMVFGVNFDTGHIKGYSINYSSNPPAPPHFFRLVRGNASYGVSSFQDNGDGTISDLATGLMWQQTDSGSGMDWEHALSYAQTQNQARFLGHDDWRVPSAKELQSLVDYSRSPDATDAAHVGPSIDPLFTCGGITNEAGKADYPWYWTSTSAVYSSGGSYTYAWYVAFGRAVDANGEDVHGAGAVRFDPKAVGNPVTPGDSVRINNYVRLVRDASPAATLALYLPAVAHLRGLSAIFTSRLEMLNTGPSPMTVEARYVPRSDIGGLPRTITLTLAPGILRSVDDPLVTWFGFTASDRTVGSVTFTVTSGSPGELLVASVITAHNDDGSEYGQDLPATSEANALQIGDTASLASLVDASRTRINFAAMALDDGTVLTVQPVDPLGFPLATARTIALDTGGNAQINDLAATFALGGATDYLLEVTVTSGRTVVYASVLDGTATVPGTSDPTTILPVTAGATTVTLLELGPIQGLNEFSGSAQISNLSETSAEVTADFSTRGIPGVATSTTFVIPAGDTLGYQDLVGDLLGASGVGTVVLRTTNGTQIMATGREFAVLRNAAGEVTGTAGQLIPGMTDAEQLQPGVTYHLLGLRQRSLPAGLERSHLAAFNPGSQDATITVTLLDGATGTPEGTTTLTARAAELVRLNNVIPAINPAQDGTTKRLQVTTNHPVFLKAFRVNPWGDPVTIDALAQ